MKGEIEIGKAIAEWLHPFAEVGIYDREGAQVALFNPLGKRKGKERVIPFEGGEMRLKLDLTPFSGLLELVSAELTPTPWESQVEATVAAFLRERQVTLAGASRHQKRELVYHLFLGGAFAYKEAATHLAERLGISRATLYNYLKVAKAEFSLWK